MLKLKSISKRSAIILVCMILLFGNMFIPVSAVDNWCPTCNNVTTTSHGVLPAITTGPDATYCWTKTINVIWMPCKHPGKPQVSSQTHNFPQPIALYHVVCKNPDCGQTKCVGSACLQCY